MNLTIRRVHVVSLFMLILCVIGCQPAATPDIPNPTFLDGLLAFFQSFTPQKIAWIVGIIEFILRIFPSAMPLSLLVPVKYVLDSLVYVFGVISEFLALLVNHGNNVTPPAAPPPSPAG